MQDRRLIIDFICAGANKEEGVGGFLKLGGCNYRRATDATYIRTSLTLNKATPKTVGLPINRCGHRPSNPLHSV